MKSELARRSISPKRSRSESRSRSRSKSRSRDRADQNRFYHSPDREYRRSPSRKGDWRSDWANWSASRRNGLDDFISYRKKLRDETSVSPLWERSPSRSPSPPSKRTNEDTYGKSGNARNHLKSSHQTEVKVEKTLKNTKVTEKKNEENQRKDREESRERELKEKQSKKKVSNESKKDSKIREKREKHVKKRKRRSSSSTDSSSDSYSSSSDESAAESVSSSSESESEEEINEKNIVWTEKPVQTEKVIEDAPVGPLPLPKVESGSYGGALLPGEGDAIAQFVKENKRIPRRGEIGLTSEEIEQFEKSGYVMSGSRHKKMNAVRIRKENQVYSAEEKRALIMANFEERAKRENKIIADFRDILHQKIGSV